MTPFAQAYSALTDGQRIAVTAWLAAAQTIPGGIDVALNVKEENQLEAPVFLEALERLATAYETTPSAFPDPKNAEISYSTVCREPTFHFKGSRANVGKSTVLQTVVNKPGVKKLLQNVTGYATEDEAWDAFWGPAITDADRLDLLNAIQPFDDRKEIVWIYFDPSLGETTSKLDPLAGQKVDAICRTLGLPTEWYPYRVGEHVYKFRYVIADPAMNAHVPSTMDANAKGWNPYFHPAIEARGVAKWGWTRPLGGARGENGMPEAIHNAFGKVAFEALPEDLGVRKG